MATSTTGCIGVFVTNSRPVFFSHRVVDAGKVYLFVPCTKSMEAGGSWLDAWVFGRYKGVSDNCCIFTEVSHCIMKETDSGLAYGWARAISKETGVTGLTFLRVMEVIWVRRRGCDEDVEDGWEASFTVGRLRIPFVHASWKSINFIALSRLTTTWPKYNVTSVPSVSLPPPSDCSSSPICANVIDIRCTRVVPTYRSV